MTGLYALLKKTALCLDPLKIGGGTRFNVSPDFLGTEVFIPLKPYQYT